MTQTIEQLTARVRELEEENARLHEQVDLQIPAIAFKQLTEQLTASQAYAEQLREALLTCQKKQIIYECRPTQNYKTYDSELVAKALALPHDTSALDAFVAGKVLHLQEEHADLCRMNAEATSLAKELTRQRDLAAAATKRVLRAHKLTVKKPPELMNDIENELQEIRDSVAFAKNAIKEIENECSMGTSGKPPEGN